MQRITLRCQRLEIICFPASAAAVRPTHRILNNITRITVAISSHRIRTNLTQLRTSTRQAPHSIRLNSRCERPLNEVNNSRAAAAIESRAAQYPPHPQVTPA